MTRRVFIVAVAVGAEVGRENVGVGGCFVGVGVGACGCRCCFCSWWWRW